MGKLIGVVLLAIAVSGCQNLHVEPIYTVQEHPIAPASRGMKAEDISLAIAQAAQSSGWMVERVGSRQIKATQKWEDHAAVVSISNDDQAFSIVNNGSVNLKEHDGLIHRQYNIRVRALEAAIDKQLSQKP